MSNLDELTDTASEAREPRPSLLLTLNMLNRAVQHYLNRHEHNNSYVIKFSSNDVNQSLLLMDDLARINR